MSSAVYRVLFAEDNQHHYELTRELLSLSDVSTFRLDWAPDYDSAWKAICERQHDAYLLDHHLGDREGIDLLRRAVREGCRVPIIMLTGDGDAGLDVESMRAGATDYLLKTQLTSQLLERTLRYAIERSRAEEALKSSQEYARAIVDSSLDMIVAVNNSRQIIEFNKAAERTFDYQADEVIGRPVDMLYEDPREGTEVAKAVFKSGYCIREIVNRRRNGERFPSLLSASLLCDAAGKHVGVMGISRDITRERIAADEIRKLNEELESRVLLRTRQLQAVITELNDQIAERQRLQEEREHVIAELREAIARVKQLSGLLPICSHCKKIRDDGGDWQPLEGYIRDRSQAQFTHSICPDCTAQHYPTLVRSMTPQRPSHDS